MEDAGQLGYYNEAGLNAHFTEIEETCPCKICGQLTINTGTQLCNGCWEVQSRIDDYLRHPKGYEDILKRVLVTRLTKKDKKR